MRMSRHATRQPGAASAREAVRTAITPDLEKFVSSQEGSRSLEAWLSPAASFRAPWTLPLPLGHGSFFAVISGSCRMQRSSVVPGEATPPVRMLNAGDLVVVSEGNWILHDQVASQSMASARVTASEHRPAQAPQRQETELLCGGFRIAGQDASTSTLSLPTIIHVVGVHGKLVPWADHLLQLLQEESGRGPGRAQLMMDRLFSILLVNALREETVASSGDNDVDSKTLQDEEVAQALARIHAQLSFPWTVARLADAVGLSRSGFAARFTQSVGQPPWDYLRDLRMELASRLLREGGHGLKEIAVRTGYKTPSAISTAFKRWSGMSPLEYRRSERAKDAAERESSSEKID